tara:strand:- start:282 stop:635 length:354 start_codon:yes stop_codon:yes gene_type:complete
MYSELNTSQIADQLMSVEAFGKSYAASIVMAEYLEHLEDSLGESMELDPIAIRCEFSFDTIENYAFYYSDQLRANGIAVTSLGRFCDHYSRQAVIEWLEERTVLIHVEADFFIMGEL